MWPTLLVMAVAVSLEPFRLGMTVLMLNRPRPRLQLTALLAGGFLMGLSVGAVVLLVVGSRLPTAHGNTLPGVQVAIGVAALLAAVVVAVTKGRRRTPPSWLLRLLGGPSLRVAGLAGLGMALPSLDYLAALAVIGAGAGTATARLAALLVFTAVAFAPVEIALLASLAAPRRTHDALTAVNRWVRARRRREVAALLAVTGTVLVTAGLLGG